MPIIQVRLALNGMKRDDLLVIYADDETFESEFERFCYLADIVLVKRHQRGEYQEYLVQVLK